MNTNLILSQVESRHFGVNIGRCVWQRSDDIAMSLAIASARRIALLVARCDAADFALIRAATAAGAFLTDVLVELSAPSTLISARPPADIRVRPVRGSDAARLVELTTAAFTGYPGHYRQDPDLASHLADGLYPAWMYDALQRAEQPDTPLLVAEWADVLVGACVLQQEPDALDVRLLAVAPEARGSGVFDALLTGVAALARERRLTGLRYTTQLNNLAAQRAAQRCGMRSSGAQITFHAWLNMPPAVSELI